LLAACAFQRKLIWQKGAEVSIQHWSLFSMELYLKATKKKQECPSPSKY